MSYLLTNISYLRESLKGQNFSQMKAIAFGGLRSVVEEHRDEFIRLHEGKPDWWAAKQRVGRVKTT